MEALMKNLFSVAGVALLGHIVFCSALRLRLCDRDDVIRELFAVPNSFITGGVGPRLLRLRYYLPWREPAADSLEGDALSRILLFCAREALHRCHGMTDTVCSEQQRWS
jgi:hypothetical protein